MWDFSFKRRVLHVDGKKLKVVEQFSEVLDHRVGQRNVLVKARNIDNNIMSLLKIRYQLDPEIFGFFGDENKEIMEIAEEDFLFEVQAAMVLSEAGLGPQYINYERRTQPEWMPFPKGCVHVLVMKVPPGENLDEIRDDLTDRQLDSIRTQLAHILEIMRQNYNKMIQQHPSYLNYDVHTNKLYLVDLAGLGFTDPDDNTSFPIDEESPYVEAFNLWREPYHKVDEGSEEAGETPSPDKRVVEKSHDPTRPVKKQKRPPWRH
ncbi:hypothetical protein P170DRAFT_351400 [Aspergillus steynii IBT 23096]|uniref:Protein kinase domain-containing protein n=1 Tax=Aspergillus steynii IBT 23096 TaxID=1392250 RepID=A0A2I2GK76_9EURO|nr:uncharacterized protein P170DRAFT_351400 [Aspergillus steynii IBT 23096]PLB53284.1 hypothetical protein P170DRAFT_351400 [Aspergillus steynii IBT 23096]